MKKITLNYSLIISFLLFSVNSSFGQTYLGVSVGYDDLKMTTNTWQYYVIDDTEWQSPNFTCGIRLEQQLPNSLMLSLQGHYKRNEINLAYGGIIPSLATAEFNTYRISTSLKWFPIKNVSIGVGFNYDYIPFFIQEFKEHPQYSAFFVPEESIQKEKVNRKDIGGIISVGYIFKGFYAELYYIHGFSVKGDPGLKRIYPAKARGISIGYRHQLFDKLKFNSKKANRPRL